MKILQLLILILVLFLVNSKLDKCKWIQSSSLESKVAQYLQYPKHGSCHYSLVDNGWSRADKQIAIQLLLFINSNQFNNLRSHFILDCLILKNNETRKCQISLPINFFYQKQEKFQPNIKAFIRIQNQRMIIDFQNSSVRSLLLKGNFSNQKFNHLQKRQKQSTKQQTLYLKNKLLYYLLPFVYFVLTQIIKSQHIIKAYQRLNQIIILEIISLCIKNLFSALQETFQDDEQRSFLKILTLFLSYFIVFGICLKLLFDNLQQGPIEFAIKEQGSQNALFRQEKNQKINKSRMTYRFLGYLQKIYRFYMQKGKFTQRIIRLFITISLISIMGCLPIIIQAVVTSIFVILLSAYFQLKNINTSTEFQTDMFSRTQILKSLDRDGIMFPKILLSIYFLLQLLKILSNFQIYELNYSIFIFQITSVILLWLTILSIVRLITSNKMGKKVFLYSPAQIRKNVFLQILKIFKIFKKQQMNQSRDEQCKQGDCCICLQPISKCHMSQQKCVQTQCGHIFHFECFSGWAKNKMICPIDRNSLNRQMVEKIILSPEY